MLEFADAAGIHLDEWQQFSLVESLRVRDDKWAAFSVAVNAPRQNGKNGTVEVRELGGLWVFGEKLQMHTAHLADTAQEGFRRIEQILDANEWLSRDVKHIRRQNGHEAVELHARAGGGRIRFRTRTKGGGRGFAGAGLIVFDEAMIFPEVSLGAILPVVSVHPNPQLWFTGSAVDQETMEDGLVFARLRNRGIAGDDPSLAYFEWSLPYDTPDDVPADVAADPAAWAASNPALGIRIAPGYVEKERREMSSRMFAVERLGVGDWPDPDLVEPIIDTEAWAALADPASQPNDPLVLVYDVSPDRAFGSVAVAGRRDDGLTHLELLENGRGTGWIAEFVAEKKTKHDVRDVFCDATGPGASLMADLAALGVEVTPVSAGEHAQACGMLFDAVKQGTLRHLGSPEVVAAMRGAARRELGDSWAWKRKSSAVDISPLVSFTLALWGVASRRPTGQLRGFA